MVERFLVHWGKSVKAATQVWKIEMPRQLGESRRLREYANLKGVRKPRVPEEPLLRARSGLEQKGAVKLSEPRVSSESQESC